MIEEGDFSGPSGARMVLRRPEVEIAVLETARGGLLRRGLAVERADAAVIGVLTMQAIESAVGGGVIRPGQSINGTFDTKDSRLPDQSYFERWTLSATEGQRLIITMSSSDFDSYAIVARASGNEVEYLFQDDDYRLGSLTHVDEAVDEANQKPAQPDAPGTAVDRKAVESELALSVKQFYDNGGAECYIVRLARNARRAAIQLESFAGTAVLIAAAVVGAGVTTYLYVARPEREAGPVAGAQSSQAREVLVGDARFGERMRYVFRHRPITGDPMALRAAEFAEYAHETANRFWDAHDALMKRGPALVESELCASVVDERDGRETLYVATAASEVWSLLFISAVNSPRRSRLSKVPAGSVKYSIDAW